MPQLLFLAGPPLDAGIFRTAAARLGGVTCRDVLDPAADDNSLTARAAALSATLREARGDIILLAHGLAVPVAIAAAIETPPLALILSNGPVTRLDPFTAALSRLASVPGGRLLLSRVLLHPSLWLRYLASSAGLRRTVANPYVMDRDNVAALAKGLVATQAARNALAGYLRSLHEGLPEVRALATPTWLLWGDEDPLYPPSEADFVASVVPGVRWMAIPGGQHYHPDERPWELAAAVAQIVADVGKVPHG